MLPAGVLRRVVQVFGLYFLYKLICGDFFVSKHRIVLTPSHLPLPIAQNECSPTPFLDYDMNKTLAQIQNGTFKDKFSYSSPCWKPVTCDRWQKTLVVIPYRNREAALKVSVPLLHYFLQRQQRDYCILLVEQVDRNFFNKAVLMNAAYRESQSLGHGAFNCFIYHDVDMIPENGELEYACAEQPVHLSPAVNTFGYRDHYGTLFGGVVAITGEQLETANGFSNRFWGWGGEDNEIEKRIFMSGLGRKAPSQNIGRYFMLPHEHSWDFKPHSSLGISTSDPVFREIRLKYNYTRLDELGAKPTDWSRDGLNNLRYTRTGFAKNEDSEFMKLEIDVSVVRLSQISIEIDAAKKYNIGWNFEEDRLEPQQSCFIDDSSFLGAIPNEQRYANETSFLKAKEKCSTEGVCSSIVLSEKENLYFLNTESVLLGSRRIHESFGSLTQKPYVQTTIWLKKCPGHLERQHQITSPIFLKTGNFTMVSMKFNLTSDVTVENDIYVYTTILPYTDKDPNVDRAKHRLLRNSIWSRIERVTPENFENGRAFISLKFPLPPLIGSYQAKTVATTKDAMAVGLYRWSWFQDVKEDELAAELEITHRILNRRPPFNHTELPT